MRRITDQMVLPFDNAPVTASASSDDTPVEKPKRGRPRKQPVDTTKEKALKKCPLCGKLVEGKCGWCKTRK